MHRRGPGGRTDLTQTPIVQGLRGIGVTVAITSDVGDGFPDLVTSSRGRIYMMDCKSGSSRDPEKVMTDDQKAFMRKWNAPMYLVWSLAGAMFALGISADGQDDCVLIMPGFKFQKPEAKPTVRRGPYARKVAG